MSAYFVDSSALVKRYVAETGSTWVSSLLAPAARDMVYVASVTVVEVAAGLARRGRAGHLPGVRLADVVGRVVSETASTCEVVELAPPVVARAVDVALRHGLRGYDAIQLAAALEVDAARRSAGETRVTLVSADLELNAAALAEGLAADDPNSHA